VSLLTKAIEFLGWKFVGEVVEGRHGLSANVQTQSGVLTIANGRVVGNTRAGNDLRMAYSQQSLLSAKAWAKQANMQVTQNSPNKLTVKLGK
jgi:hypothetical protein